MEKRARTASASNLPLPLPPRRLRGKQPRCVGHSIHLSQVLELEDIFTLLASWLDQCSFLRLAGATKTHHKTTALLWCGTELDMRSRHLRKSAQLERLLANSGDRWTRVVAVRLPQLQPSKVASKALATAFPRLEHLDLGLCPRAGGLRVLSALGSLPNLQHIMLPEYLPQSLLPHLRVLQLSGSCCELHFEGPEVWARLVERAPMLETLHAPFSDDDTETEVEMSEDLWDKLQCISSRVNDECLRHLSKLPKLRELDLSFTKTLTDVMLRTLGNLTSLETLVLRDMGPGLTRQGLQWLAEGSGPLRVLDLRVKRTGWPSPSFTQADIEAFKRWRPSVQVLFP